MGDPAGYPRNLVGNLESPSYLVKFYFGVNVPQECWDFTNVPHEC